MAYIPCHKHLAGVIMFAKADPKPGSLRLEHLRVGGLTALLVWGGLAITASWVSRMAGSAMGPRGEFVDPGGTLALAAITFLLTTPLWIVGGAWAAARFTGGGGRTRILLLATGALVGLVLPVILLLVMVALPPRQGFDQITSYGYLLLPGLALVSLTGLGAAVGEFKYRGSGPNGRSGPIGKRILALGLGASLVPGVVLIVAAAVQQSQLESFASTAYEELNFELMIPASTPDELSTPWVRVVLGEAGPFAEIVYDSDSLKAFPALVITQRDLRPSSAANKDRVCDYLIAEWDDLLPCTTVTSPGGHEISYGFRYGRWFGVVLFESTSITFFSDHLGPEILSEVVDSMGPAGADQIENLLVVNDPDAPMPELLF